MTSELARVVATSAVFAQKPAVHAVEPGKIALGNQYGNFNEIAQSNAFPWCGSRPRAAFLFHSFQEAML
jgi:hypothetical protein